MKSINDNFKTEEDALIARVSRVLGSDIIDCHTMNEKSCIHATTGQCPHINAIIASVSMLKR